MNSNQKPESMLVLPASPWMAGVELPDRRQQHKHPRSPTLPIRRLVSPRHQILPAHRLRSALQLHLVLQVHLVHRLPQIHPVRRLHLVPRLHLARRLSLANWLNLVGSRIHHPHLVRHSNLVL